MNLSNWGEVGTLNIRQWLGYEIPENQLSKVDLKLNEILNQYRIIFEKYCDIETSLSLSGLEKKINDTFFEKAIFQGFVSWFTEEGKATLLGVGLNLYKDDEILLEELNYLEFILSSESNNVKSYPDDVMGTLVDVTDQLDMLLSSAAVELELRHLTSKIVISPEDMIVYKGYIQQYMGGYDILRGNNDFMDIRDSYNNCESPFYIQ